MHQDGAFKSGVKTTSQMEAVFYFETTFSIILTDLSSQMCCVGACVCSDSGFINGNGIMIAQACPISITPRSVTASEIRTRQLPESFSPCFLLFLPGRRLHSVPTQAALFHNLLSFDRSFNHPHDLRPSNVSPCKHLAQSAPSVMQGYLMQSAKHVGVALGIC